MNKFLNKSHELTDHLGNVRVTFRKGTGSTLEVLSKTDYYAFGGQLPGRIWQQSGGEYRFGYQGQEKSIDESTWDNFELRNFNHDLGRWSAPDPYAQFHSPYIAMGNNPVSKIDPNGGYIYASDAGTAQRRKFVEGQEMDKFLQQGRYSFDFLNSHYKEAVQDLVNKRLKGPWWLDESIHGDIPFLEGLMQLNNDYAGLGFPTELMANGMDYIGIDSKTDPLFKELLDYTGVTAMANEMQASALQMQYSVDLMARGEFDWINSLDQQHRDFVNAWRQNKWDKMDKAAEEKKAAKEARDRLDEHNLTNGIIESALAGEPFLPGFAGGAMAAGSSTVNPGSAMAKAATFALTTSAADGPLPVGEVVGAVAVIGTAIYVMASDVGTSLKVASAVMTGNSFTFYGIYANLFGKARGKGERNWAGKNTGTDNPWKGWREDPKDKNRVGKNDPNGKWKSKPKPPGWPFK